VPPDLVTVTLYVNATAAAEAVVAAQRVLQSELNVEEMLDWSAPVSAEVVTEAEQVRRAAALTLPELVGASEVGVMLGVSRQRVHQLREHPGFPAPLVEVAMGPLWDARAVRSFAQEWHRRPGRPRLAVAQ
jgi:hypothetical protein